MSDIVFSKRVINLITSYVFLVRSVYVLETCLGGITDTLASRNQHSEGIFESGRRAAYRRRAANQAAA